MKNILVPVDFSAASENALYYAIELAKHENARLVILNVYGEGYDGFSKKESENGLRSQASIIDHAGNVPYELLSMPGQPEDAILHVAHRKKSELIVIGTRDRNSLGKMLLGGMAARIIDKAMCPVVAIPEGVSVHTIKRVTYATDYHYSDLPALRKLLELVKPYQAQLNILHVSNLQISGEQQKDLMKQFMRDVSDILDYNNISFQLLSGEDTEEELRKHVDEGSADLLVMSTHNKSLFDRVFNNSLAKEMSEHPKVPVMVFHYNKEAAVKVY